MQSTTQPAVRDATLARWAWAAGAAAVAMFLMIYYVMLLQDSVARGAQWRYSQSTAQAEGVAKTSVAAPTASVRLVSTGR